MIVDALHVVFGFFGLFCGVLGWRFAVAGRVDYALSILCIGLAAVLWSASRLVH